MPRNVPTTLTISQIGERLNIEVVSGATFGPVNAKMTNPPVVDGGPRVPVDLTNCTIRGSVRAQVRAGGAPLADVTAEITNAPGGEYTFEIDEVVMEAIPTPADKNVYWWNLEMVDSQERVIPLYFSDFIVYATAARPDSEETEDPCGC